MNVIAAMHVDLKVTPLGTKSRLLDEIGGVAILRRTVERISRAKNLSGVFVLTPREQTERCRAVLDGTPAAVQGYDADPPPWAQLVQAARKWSLDGWRGGIGSTTHFDEFTDARLLSGLLHAHPADAVLSVPAAAPLIDPALADRMIEHLHETKDDSQLTFTQAPPGIAGIVLGARLVHEIAGKGIPVGWILSYKPDTPQKDLIFHPCCFQIPPELRHADGRLTADTGRSTERIAALLRDHEAPDLATIGRWLTDRKATEVERLPREVEIELTTDDPYPDALLRPRGSRVDRRGPIDLERVEQIVREITHLDDALIVLGGFGDPLLHPRFVEILECIRVAAAPRGNGHALYGIAVRTSGVDLTDEHIDALITHEVDVLNVLLDAWTPALYSRVQSPGRPDEADLEVVVERLNRLAEVSRQRKSARPIVVPEMTKARENVDELDDFYDGWLRRVGAVVISGYSRYGGQCEDRIVFNMAPSSRVGCRRISSRCLVLADGRVAVCDQDFNGRHTVGQIGEQSLSELWRGAAFERVRDAHRQGRFDPTPLCAVCDEWHRP
jgi:spiro-SPASM protein